MLTTSCLNFTYGKKQQHHIKSAQMTCYEVDFRLVKGFSESYQSFLGVWLVGWLVAFWNPLLRVVVFTLKPIVLVLFITQYTDLQSCVGTWARLGYAAFDVQLRKAYFVTTLYTRVS